MGEGSIHGLKGCSRLVTSYVERSPLGVLKILASSKKKKYLEIILIIAVKIVKTQMLGIAAVDDDQALDLRPLHTTVE